LYTAAGQRLARTIRSTISVDDALYQLSEFPESVELGKVCILRAILKAERNSSLRLSPETGELPQQAGRDGWIEHIFSMAITGFRHSELKSAFKNITFVNFNYDRCIEHYLYWSLIRLDVNSNDAAEIVDGLNIIRPYGSLGSILPGRESLPFGAPSHPNFFQITNRIRTFTESDAIHDKSALETSLQKASMILYLGFGFHPQNLDLLTFPAEGRASIPAKILATVFEVDEANLPELKDALAERQLIHASGVETHPMTASEILTKLRMKINMAVG
jgi:hypothetical protein